MLCESLVKHELKNEAGHRTTSLDPRLRVGKWQLESMVGAPIKSGFLQIANLI